MKTNQSTESRSERARDEKIDSEGRFESNHKSGMKNEKSSDNQKSSDKMNHRGENAKSEPRDSHGRFESKDERKK